MQRAGHRAQTTTLANPNMAPSERVGLFASSLGLAHRGHERKGLVAGRDANQLIDGERAGHGVSRQLDVSLELSHRLRGCITEDAVDSPGIEPERTQAALELSHIVTPLHRLGPVQESRAQVEASFNQGRPRSAPHDPVDPEAPLALEQLNGRSGRRAELTDRVGDGTDTEVTQSSLDVSNRGARGPLLDGKDPFYDR